MHVFPNDLGTSRLGLSVSRKVGNAVTRNALRRRLREVFHATLPEIRQNLDIVISARPAAAQAHHGELKRHFVHALEKLQVVEQTGNNE